MVLEKLGESLRESMRKLFKGVLIDPRLIGDLVSDIKKSLIASDVNVELANKLAESIKRRALAEKPSKTLTAREHTVNIVYEELVKFLGSEFTPIKIDAQPTKILLVGLFGSGKTTTAGKLAKYYKKQGLKVCMVQTDTWRPAAYEQLSQLAAKVNVPFYGIKEEKDPIKILKKFEPDFARFNVVIVDSAGRDALNRELIDEIKRVREFLKPHESILVLSGDIGQGALKQAQAFQSAANVTGMIISKLDGTAKGGGAISACAATGAKVKFIGVGEHIDDLEEYKPKNFVSRLLGMGDLETLLQKAQGAIKKDEAEKLAKKVLKGDMNLEDLYKQLESLQKMGPLSQIMGMIPGMGMAKIPKELLETQGEKMKFWKFVIQSMTSQEKEHPEIINSKRIARIAKGSGRPESDVRELIKQYNQMKKMMKTLGNQKQMQKLQKMFGGKLPPGLGI
ncbi:MAG: signal recognition particle receptor subunit alpha [archaeon]